MPLSLSAEPMGREINAFGETAHGCPRGRESRVLGHLRNVEGDRHAPDSRRTPRPRLDSVPPTELTRITAYSGRISPAVGIAQGRPGRRTFPFRSIVRRC